LLAKFFVGPNDGLVSETSFAFGERYQLISHKGDRGISHLDTVDLLHQNLPDFDIREFYVELVSDLKNRGL
jgi:triacylglycerol lipase